MAQCIKYHPMCKYQIINKILNLDLYISVYKVANKVTTISISLGGSKPTPNTMNHANS